MVHNVLGIDAILADGSEVRVRAARRNARRASPCTGRGAQRRSVRASTTRSTRMVPRCCARRRLQPSTCSHPQSVRPYTADGSVNFAHLLVGSEGTLALLRALKLQLARLPAKQARWAWSTSRRSIARRWHRAQHIVTLEADRGRASSIAP